jgi:hypothetical protein
MKNRFKLTKSLGRSAGKRPVFKIPRLVLVAKLNLSKTLALGLGPVLLALQALPASAQLSQLGPLIELSVPNAVGTCDDGVRVPGNMTVADAAEPFVAVNPVRPNNIVAAWIQGPFQNNVSATSFDGGVTWQRVPLPLTTCSGGLFAGAGDPWLSFAPNGDLYAIGLTGPDLSDKYTVVCKSTDGGLHWSDPVTLDTPDFAPDKTTITADPTDSRLIYATWDRRNYKDRDEIGFARSMDGGNTWEAARSILATPSGQIAQNTQILVLPDGTLVDMFYLQYQKPNQPVSSIFIQLMRSRDKGVTWSAPITVAQMQMLLQPNSTGETLTVDPDTGAYVGDTTDPSFAVDSRSGNLYAVWEDARFSNFQHNDIAFSMSSDGGFNWSAPIRINQTPLNIPPLDRQAFYPTIAVAANGTIGVTYYDFRFNTPDPGVPTDCWLVQCHPSPGTPATAPANWGNEVRLTSASFNLEALPFVIDGLWFGDYLGLAPAGGGGFISAFAAVDPNNTMSIFARRIGQ